MNQISTIYDNINKSIDLINLFDIEISNELRFGPDYNIIKDNNLEDDIIYLDSYIIELKKWLEDLDTILHKEFF